MKEQIIEYETAKLAKEKGFNIESLYTNEDLPSIENIKEYYLAPTQSLLQKWLREVHIINCFVIPYITLEDVKYCYIIFNNKEEQLYNEDFKTYEEALEKGLQLGLQLIKNNTEIKKL